MISLGQPGNLFEADIINNIIINTTPYCPQGNPQAERTNRTFVNMLKALSLKEKQNWRKHLPKLAFAINSTKCKTTNFSPYFLLFGREALLPIDQVLQGVDEDADRVVSHNQFAKTWETSMKNAFDIARENIRKASTYNKKHFDKRVNTVELEVDDMVLVRNLRQKEGKPKMQSWYEENLFKVTEKKEGIPVYTIKNIKKSKDVRVLHRNKLLRVNEMPLDVFEEDHGKVSATKDKKRKNSKRNKNKGKQEREVSTDSESEYDLVVVESRREENHQDKENVNVTLPAEEMLQEKMALPLVEQVPSDGEPRVLEEISSPEDTARVTGAKVTERCC